MFLGLLEHFDHLSVLESKSFYFREVALQKFCLLLIPTKEEKLGNFLLILNIAIIIIWQRGRSDYLDQLMILDFLQLALQAFDRRKRLYFKVLGELVKIFLIFRIVDSGIYPIIWDLFGIFQTDFIQFLYKIMVFIIWIDIYK